MAAHLKADERLTIARALASGESTAAKIAAQLGARQNTVYDIRREMMRLGLEVMEGGDEKPEPLPPDPVSERRAKDEAAFLRRENNALVRRVVELEDIRSGILGLGPIVKSRIGVVKTPASHGARSAILHLSDVHYAEVIDPDEIDGVNSYNAEIANRRLDRTFDTVCRLLTDHWKGEPPEMLYLCLGGDMVSGALHPELTRTDELLRLPSAKQVAGRIAGGIRMIRQRVGCPVTVLSVPGNHGRLTVKPESKGHVPDNLDTLVSWFVESAVSDDKAVQFRYGDSVDCLFQVYRFPFLLTHGDRMGSRGGQGFLGPVATILRGHQKLYSDYAERGVILYRILTAHLHTTARLPIGYGNGSLAGWSQFVRDMRARKEPASQNLLIVHSEKGVIDFKEIHPGTPDEGSIYA